jgi:5-methyltetrahydrofolate--homocysteine methyltransferase
MTTEPLDALKNALLDLDKAKVLKIVDATAASEDAGLAKQAIDDIAAGLQIVGSRFQEGEWFLNELVYSGEIAKQAMERLSPMLRDEGATSRGTVVIGTVLGDLHDLGKNIFVNYATSAGFEVIDLGVNVAVDDFTKAVVDHQPVALGISCLLTSAAGGIGRVIETLSAQSLRNPLKVIIGGAAITEAFANEVGADAFAPDAVTGTDIIRTWNIES